MAGSISFIELYEQKIGGNILYILTYLLSQILVSIGVHLVNTKAVLNNTEVDRAPVGKGCQLCVGIVLTNNTEYTGVLGLTVKLPGLGYSIVHPVKIIGNTVQH